MQGDETFDGRVQRVGQGLQNLVAQVNSVRQMMRNRVQSAREIVAKPVIETWQKTRPHPLGLEMLERASLQPEHTKEARQVEIKQAEPKPVEPIFQGLWDLISRPKTIEAPQVEVQEQIEQPVKIEVEPKSTPHWEKPALL